MNKLKVILMILVLPLLLTGCKKRIADVVPEEKTEVKDDGMFSGSLKDLMKVGKSQKCVTRYEDENGVLNTEIFVDGKRSYVESTISTTDQADLTTYSLFDEEWFYTWGDHGISTKMRLDEMEELGKDLEDSMKGTSFEFDKEEAMQESQEEQENIDYKCESWKVDESKFTPPANINFTDMAKAMQGIVDSVEDGELSGSMCSVCEILTAEADIADCKINMGCE